jgi:hypothetical protein
VQWSSPEFQKAKTGFQKKSLNSESGRDPVEKRGLFVEPPIQPLSSTRSGYHERFGALLYPSRKHNTFRFKNRSVPFFINFIKEGIQKVLFFIQIAICCFIFRFEFNKYSCLKSLIFMELTVETAFHKQIFFCYIKQYYYFG